MDSVFYISYSINCILRNHLQITAGISLNGYRRVSCALIEKTVVFVGESVYCHINLRIAQTCFFYFYILFCISLSNYSK